jgi:sec-independent protein translocase protein TatA
MNIFGIGLPEMVLIFIVALLIFGPKKLPEVGRSLGKALKSFQDASKEFEAEFKREADRLAETVQEATLEPPTPPQLAQGSSSAEVEESAVAEKEQEQV